MLSISAIGLASPLGGMVQAGAALRAGISFASPAPDEEFMAPGDEAPAPVVVHALPSATFGFTGLGRLVALVAEAMRDLEAQGPTAWPERGLGLFLALPDPIDRGIPLAAEPEDDEPEGQAVRLAELGRRLAALVRAATGQAAWRLTPEVVGGGHAAVAEALSLAREALQQRRITTALVCAVDSLVSAEALELLLESERVKTGENPVGFVPGEAAAVILLEAGGSGTDQGTGVQVAGIGRAVEPHGVADGQPPEGRALAECVRAVLRADATPLVVSDHDGEAHRADELGRARLHLQGTHPRAADAVIWYPALSFGNTGAASGAVGLATAVRALQRRAVEGDSAVVLSSSDDGGRTAIHITWRRRTALGAPREANA